MAAAAARAALLSRNAAAQFTVDAERWGAEAAAIAASGPRGRRRCIAPPAPHRDKPARSERGPARIARRAPLTPGSLAKQVVQALKREEELERIENAKKAARQARVAKRRLERRAAEAAEYSAGLQRATETARSDRARGKGKGKGRPRSSAGGGGGGSSGSARVKTKGKSR